MSNQDGTGGAGFKFKPKITGLAAALDQQRKAGAITTTTDTTNNFSTTITEEQKKTEVIKINLGTAKDAKDKIRIIFDNSASMSGEAIDDAREGCIEFMRNCGPGETAVAIHILNSRSYEKPTEQLTTDLPSLSTKVRTIRDGGSTPLFARLAEAQNAGATRFIVFSDGQPDSESMMEQCITTAIERKTPIDTVYITKVPSTDYNKIENRREYIILKEIADRTGGYFLVFDRNKVNFRDAFKYLAPSLRLRLSDGNVRKALEEGRL